jgi:hypothetical protein
MLQVLSYIDNHVINYKTGAMCSGFVFLLGCLKLKKLFWVLGSRSFELMI